MGGVEDRMTVRLIVSCALISGSWAFPGSEFLSRVKRDDCQAIQTAHGECTQKAYADYQAEWAAGDDGRPDWVARKTCNYLTGSIEDCGNKLVESGCVSQEEVDRMKDNQMAASLQQVKDNVQSWDSTKCPPVKSYLQRMGLLPTETPVCERVKADHKECTAKAYTDYMQNIGLIPADHDEDTSSANSVGARFGGTEEEEEDGSDDEAQALRSSEDSINQGPWGLAAYAYYFWSGATDQSDRFTRSWSAFMNVWNNH